MLFASFASASAAGQDATANPRVVLETSKGAITIELYPDKAPKTVENFLQYIDSGHYNNTVFHRVIGPNPRQPQGFMIQGGGFAAGQPISEKATRAPIPNEADNGLRNERGTIAMARTSDPHSASAQFFINLSDNAFLNHTAKTQSGWGYAVFGKVVEGMDVVDQIARVQTGRAPARVSSGQTAPFDDVPVEPVVIRSARRAQ
ncbi:peptidylprolyl isomerase [Tautonia sociabilis]|uniref:Peptidyl-prolyl cis-trans isomerase n=1 Tax=Tautonia sociabilis TaxID=2080755 RepID=A0A432MLM7_9BACT|nr:peptidyl-prolyl cis-trans isomerase [Tautonia sociabilis]